MKHFAHYVYVDDGGSVKRFCVWAKSEEDASNIAKELFFGDVVGAKPCTEVAPYKDVKFSGDFQKLDEILRNAFGNDEAELIITALEGAEVFDA